MAKGNMIQRITNKISLLWNSRRIRPLQDAPITVPHAKSIDENRQRVENYYAYYIKNISRADMAASLELIAFLLAIIKENKLVRLSDLGSGFSSFAFRYIAQGDSSTSVCSVDDNVGWLEKTKEILNAQNLPTSNVISLDQFIQSAERNFDLLLLDLNFVDVRKNYIRLAVERCRKGGVIIFDDVHKPEYMQEVLKQTESSEVSLFSIRNETLDSFGRYALMAIKN